MIREFSAGGVVLRRMRKRWHLAAIQPRGKGPGEGSGNEIFALPKGLVDPGERPEQTAVREVREETGVTAELIAKLGDIKYVYTRTFSDGQRVFKVVSFYLLAYRSGTIGSISADMQHEVSRALWIPLDSASRQLSYKGEREVAAKALDYVNSHPELEQAPRA
jgi:8-oxo-dGTP pyrophosphatase MutT (NUDIX family)